MHQPFWVKCSRKFIILRHACIVLAAIFPGWTCVSRLPRDFPFPLISLLCFLSTQTKCFRIIRGSPPGLYVTSCLVLSIQRYITINPIFVSFMQRIQTTLAFFNSTLTGSSPNLISSFQTSVSAYLYQFFLT